MEKDPQPKPELQETDSGFLIASGLVNPSITLLRSSKQTHVVLAQNSIREGHCIRLENTRFIEVPRNWQMKLYGLLSRFICLRFPDEFEFALIEIETNCPAPVARANGDFLCQVPKIVPVILLSRATYLSLLNCRGRYLRMWIAANFQSQTQPRLGKTDAA
jgi:hypothetical protein